MYDDKYQRIAIAGCGGIGSKIAELLIRCGVNKLKLVDFDIIEQSNLNRQFFFQNQIKKQKIISLKHNLLKINKNIDIVKLNKKINEKNIEKVFSDCDIIIEGFDTYKDFILVYKKLKNKKLIVLSAAAPTDWNMDTIETRKLFDNIYAVGSFDENYVDIEGETYPPKILNIVTIMVDIVLNYLKGIENVK